MIVIKPSKGLFPNGIESKRRLTLVDIERYCYAPFINTAVLDYLIKDNLIAILKKIIISYIKINSREI